MVTPRRRSRFYRLFSHLTILCCSPLPGVAREAIYLQNGFCLQAESHTRNDLTVVLRTVSGSVELPLSEIDRIEIVPGSPEVQPVKVGTAGMEQLLDSAARAQGLPPEFVRSVAKIESGLRQAAISRKGALGLMQLMPATAAELGVDPAQAQQNAEGGARYLRQLLIRFHYDSARALAAYNAGSGTVLRAGGIPPISETVHYIQQVLREYSRLQNSQPKIEMTQALPRRPTATD